MNLSEFYYNTHALMVAEQLVTPKPCWLRDTFFADVQTPDADRILVEYKDEQSRMIAPVVVPGKGDVAVRRAGYKASDVIAPLIAPSRTLTVDDVSKKQFAESLYSNLSPSERAVQLISQDMQDLDEMISTREEQMAAQVLTENALDLKQIADDQSKTEDFTLKFYDGDTNGAKVTFSKALTSADDFFDVVRKMAAPLKKRGLPHDKFVMGAEVGEIFFNNEKIQKLLDNRRIVVGDINIQDLNGVTFYGTLNVPGVGPVDFYSYDQTYVDLDGTEKFFVPTKGAFITGQRFGKRMYQRITFINDQTKEIESQPGTRVPHVYTDSKNSARTLALKSRPLNVPYFKNSSIYADLIF
ncbi:major capsid protein [Anaerolactibacter massiliensis]|uniref:major capsid protein n=1 Tax=Anaerolactibacter massiliensis TaxID=2044573 RepID=UPI000CFA1AD8|nr:major capsid protein [Anaerolactibacter massiliensis]